MLLRALWQQQRNSVCSAMNIITTQAFYFAPLVRRRRARRRSVRESSAWRNCVRRHRTIISNRGCTRRRRAALAEILSRRRRFFVPISQEFYGREFLSTSLYLLSPLSYMFTFSCWKMEMIRLKLLHIQTEKRLSRKGRK